MAECDRTDIITEINGQNPDKVNGWVREPDVRRYLLCPVDA
jgi:hypothetical protein